MVKKLGGISVSTTQARITPAWVRMQGAVQLSSLSRTRLYELIHKGAIRSTLIKSRRDALRGIRLISADSLLAYIETNSQEGK